MADFASLLADVYTLTNRPDLVAETTLAVKSATLECHNSEVFFKDLFETGITFDTATYLQTIDYRVLFPRYKSLKYIRKFDSSSNTPGLVFTRITTDQIFDSFSYQRQDVYYVAGEVIQLRSSTQDLHALMGVYLNPDISSAANYSSWIAIEQPYAIVHKAAGKVFGVLGNDKSKNAQDILAQECLAGVIRNNLVATSD